VKPVTFLKDKALKYLHSALGKTGALFLGCACDLNTLNKQEK
jgi:hypothetical protein